MVVVVAVTTVVIVQVVGYFSLFAALIMGLLDMFHSETPRERMRRYKRSLDKTCRELDREVSKLTQQERKIQSDMKTMAKKDQIDSVRVMARDLVRTRKFNQKMYRMRVQVQGVGLRVLTMQSTADMTAAMRGVTRTMKAMNSRVKMPAIQRIVQDFERANAEMSEKGECMDEAIDDALDEEGDEDEEVEQEVQKIVDEANIDFRSKVGIADGKLGQTASTEEDAAKDKDLDARLAAFRTTMEK